MKYEYTSEDFVEMQRKRDEGMEPCEIAELYGCTENYVNTHTFVPKIKRIDCGRAQALFDAGWSLPDIADELKCTMDEVASVVTPRAVRSAKKPLEGLWPTF